MPTWAWLRYTRLLGKLVAEEALLAENIALTPYASPPQRRALRNRLMRQAELDRGPGAAGSVAAEPSETAWRARLGMTGITVVYVEGGQHG